MRLTTAVEQLRVSAEAAIRSDNEAGARQLLEEKARVMEALQLAQSRADIFEALTSKLNQAISRKESELIAALSFTETATSAPSSTILVVPPSPPDMSSAAEETEEPTEGVVPSDPKETERERALQSVSDEELKERFLDMERADLERMWRRSEESISREGMEWGRGTGEDGSASSPLKDGFPPQSAPGAATPSFSPEFSTETIEPVDVTPGRERSGSLGSLDRAELAYLQAVDEEIAQVKVKLEALEKGSSEQDGREELETRIARAKDVLAELLRVRSKIMANLAANPSGSASAHSSEQRDPFLEQGPQESVGKPSALEAVGYLRNGDNVGAAACLQKWLESSAGSLAPSTTWGELAANFPEAHLSPMEGKALYLTYVRHYVVPTILANAASSWETLGPEFYSPTSTLTPRLARLQELFGLEREEVAADHERMVRMAAMDEALSRVGASSTVNELASVLGLSEGRTLSIEAEAQSAAKLKRLVGAVLRELRGSGTAEIGWRDASWTLQDWHAEEIKSVVEILGLDSPSALAATAAACRDHCRELLEQATAALARGAGSAKLCSLQLENLVLFVQAAALPAMLAASGNSTSAMEDLPKISISQDSTRTAGSNPAQGEEEEEGHEEVASAPPLAANLIGLLRVPGLRGVESESLYSAFWEEKTRAIAQEAMESASKSHSSELLETEAPEGGGPQPLGGSCVEASVLAAVLGLPPAADSAIRTRAAKQAFTAAARHVAEDGRVTQREWVQLGVQQRALGIADGDAAAIREEVGAQRVGAMCRKLLDKRSSGGDITAADIRNLTVLCTNLGATQVTGVDVRDRMALFRRAVQTALDPSSPSFKWPPARTVQDCTQMLAVLQRVFNLPQSEVDSAIAAVTSVSASAALLQARASLRRGEMEMAADDIGRLAVVLGMHPQSVPLPQDTSQWANSSTEARELFELYGGPYAGWTRNDQGFMNTFQERELEESILKRMRSYLRV